MNMELEDVCPFDADELPTSEKRKRELDSVDDAPKGKRQELEEECDARDTSHDEGWTALNGPHPRIVQFLVQQVCQLWRSAALNVVEEKDGLCRLSFSKDAGGCAADSGSEESHDCQKITVVVETTSADSWSHWYTCDVTGRRSIKSALDLGKLPPMWILRRGLEGYDELGFIAPVIQSLYSNVQLRMQRGHPLEAMFQQLSDMRQSSAPVDMTAVLPKPQQQDPIEFLRSVLQSEDASKYYRFHRGGSTELVLPIHRDSLQSLDLDPIENLPPHLILSLQEEGESFTADATLQLRNQTYRFYSAVVRDRERCYQCVTRDSDRTDRPQWSCGGRTAFLEMRDDLRVEYSFLFPREMRPVLLFYTCETLAAGSEQYRLEFIPKTSHIFCKVEQVFKTTRYYPEHDLELSCWRKCNGNASVMDDLLLILRDAKGYCFNVTIQHQSFSDGSNPQKLRPTPHILQAECYPDVHGLCSLCFDTARKLDSSDPRYSFICSQLGDLEGDRQIASVKYDEAQRGGVTFKVKMRGEKTCEDKPLIYTITQSHISPNCEKKGCKVHGDSKTPSLFWTELTGRSSHREWENVKARVLQMQPKELHAVRDFFHLPGLEAYGDGAAQIIVSERMDSLMKVVKEWARADLHNRKFHQYLTRLQQFQEICNDPPVLRTYLAIRHIGSVFDCIESFDVNESLTKSSLYKKFLMAYVKKNNYRRVGQDIMWKTAIEGTDHTYYKRKCGVEEAVNDILHMANSKVLWHNTDPKERKSLQKSILEDPWWPDEKISTRYLYWADGILDIHDFDFYPWDSATSINDIAFNYLAKPFLTDPVRSFLELWRKEKQRLDLMDPDQRQASWEHCKRLIGMARDILKTPHTHQIFEKQRWTEIRNEEGLDKIETTLFLMARVFFPPEFKTVVLEKLLYLTGSQGTGKSTLLRVLASYFAEAQVWWMPNKLDKSFPFSNIEGKLLVLAPELDSTLNLPVTQLKSWISGEPQTIRDLFQRSHTLKLPLPCGAGQYLPIKDADEAIKIRVVPLQFKYPIRGTRNARLNLAEEIKSHEQPELLCMMLAIFHVVVQYMVAYSVDFELLLPKEVKDERETLFREQDPLIVFLRCGEDVDLTDNSTDTLLRDEFSDLFAQFCKKYNYRVRPHSLFPKRGSIARSAEETLRSFGIEEKIKEGKNWFTSIRKAHCPLQP